MLADIITYSVGRVYLYSINTNALSKVFIDKNKVENAFKNNPPLKESEYIIKEIYDASFYGKENYYGEKGLESSTPILFDSL